MNANEVIANLALETLGHKKGEYQYVNPNDHVNFGQSTNDVYPTAFRLGADPAAGELHGGAAPAAGGVLRQGQGVRQACSRWAARTCRTRCRCRSAQEFHGWGTTIGEEVQRIAEVRAVPARDQPRRDRDRHDRDGGARLSRSSRRSTCPSSPASSSSWPSDLIEATSDTGAYVLLSGVLKRTSVKLTKICNDIRLLASGPRCGFNEINLPQMQPGSSIMPGKVNPVIPEVVNQIGFLVIGLDLTVTLAASAGQLQLNVMEPVITFALFTSIATMEHAVNSLRVNCIEGITANAERTREMVLNSLGIVTVLKPSLGYKQCAEIAREGYETGKSLHEIVVKERKLLTQEKWDEVFSFENLINPKFEQ